MAKRRKLEAPTVGDLDKVEEEFRRETRSPMAPTAPIAEIAGDAARMSQPLSQDAREAKAAATEYKKARDEGRLIIDLPLEVIDAEAVFRDRTHVSREELDELKESILANGLRLPIEVFRLPEPHGSFQFGLISGYRRLLAIRELHAQQGADTFNSVKALVREARSSADHFAAVAEENEVRSSLCHYERGRYAALTSAHGVFHSVDDAVAALFPFASKAKRSKIRSFAYIFEELGDLLSFPEALTEKQGLRLASILKAGTVSHLRGVLAQSSPGSAAEEWAVLERTMANATAASDGKGQGGRPKKPVTHHIAQMASGAKLTVTLREQAADHWIVDLSGADLTEAGQQDLLDQLSLWAAQNRPR